MHADLVQAASILEVELPALKAAAERSRDDISDFKDGLLKVIPHESIDGFDPKAIDVVLFGAHARGEATEGSDCDYIILQSGVMPEVSQRLIIAVEKVRDVVLQLPKPGGQGVFGNIVIPANLYENIGLEDDTNVNLTRRMLTLTESQSVYSDVARNDVIEKILSRYCADYLPPRREAGSSVKVPRLLLNDLVRYWRTMAVDFGAKRWRSMKGDSRLRLAKLVTTRKILFAGPLATLLLVPDRITTNDGLHDYLTEWFDKPPLAQLASTVNLLGDRAKGALAQLLAEYDRFINILNRPRKRNLLDTTDAPGFTELKKTVREIGDKIQQCLEVIFYDDPLFASNVRKYGIF